MIPTFAHNRIVTITKLETHSGNQLPLFLLPLGYGNRIVTKVATRLDGPSQCVVFDRVAKQRSLKFISSWNVYSEGDATC